MFCSRYGPKHTNTDENYRAAVGNKGDTFFFVFVTRGTMVDFTLQKVMRLSHGRRLQLSSYACVHACVRATRPISWHGAAERHSHAARFTSDEGAKGFLPSWHDGTNERTVAARGPSKAFHSGRVLTYFNRAGTVGMERDYSWSFVPFQAV